MFLKSLLANLDPADFATPATSARAPSPSPPPPAPAIHVTGVIARFETRSVRMFDQLAWEAPAAPAGWHVILGDNASGKTSLLRALALCLLDRSERDALRQAWDSWLRASSDNGEVSVRLGTTDAPSHRLSFSLHRTAAPGTAVDVQSSERLRYSGFLAAYGPFRRFTGGDAEWVKSFKAHPRLQSVLTLFDERAALSDALEWLKDLWIRARTIENAPEKDFLRDLLVFINDTGFLPEGVQILEPDADGIWCLDGNKLRVLAIDLSDGYRAVLSLALDLLRRLSVDAGYDKVFTMEPDQHVAAEGIVLIDEVDAHLHPTWQQRIGEWFKKRFPRMQFIVATHSPVVCQSADSVLLLPPPGSPDEARMATPEELNRLRYGDLLDAFATAFFGELVTRSQAGRDKMDRLAELNDQMFSRELTDEEKQTQDALNRELGMVGGVTPREPAP